MRHYRISQKLKIAPSFLLDQLHKSQKIQFIRCYRVTVSICRAEGITHCPGNARWGNVEFTMMMIMILDLIIK